MKQDIPRWLAILVAFAAIVAACAAVINLIPTFGQWLDPRDPASSSVALDPITAATAETFVNQNSNATSTRSVEPVPTIEVVATSELTSLSPLGQSDLASPTPMPTPRVLRIIGHATVQEAGTNRISLTENETAIGTADRFQDVLDQMLPPFTIFVIVGPIDEELSIWWGGWDIWENASEDHIGAEIDKKIQELMASHPADYQNRGARLVDCRGSLANCRTLQTYP